MKSFESIEKSLEERLDPKRRSIGENHLNEHDQKKQEFPASKIFRIEFSESVPEGIKCFLDKRIQGIINFPERFGMRFQSAGHILRFVEKNAYESEVGTTLPKNITLPASRIRYLTKSRSFAVMIILPENLDTAESIINITRNLFSKLYGDIFLKEKILHLEFYKQNLNEVKQITAAIPEILDLASNLDLSSESLDKHCKRIAESYRLPSEKQGSEIRKQLTGELRKKWQERALTKEEQNTIGSMFNEFLNSIRTNPEKIINSIKGIVKKLNNQLHYILPHERCDYENFEKKHIKQYMHSVLSKLEEISSLIGFIDELYSELDNLPMDTDLSEISKQILIRMQQLRREKKVIQFYVPDMPLDENLEDIRQKFPLFLIKMIPKGTPLKDWSKTVKRMEKHYSESIYSKIYSGLDCLYLLTRKEKNSKGNYIKKNEVEKRLNKILPLLKYRSAKIRATQSILGVFKEIGEQSVPDANSFTIAQRQLLPLDEFKKAWNYFISSVLTLNYYQEISNSDCLPQGFNAKNYTKSILMYVDKQCSLGINHFHIVKLLWLIYNERINSNALTFLLFCIQNPCDILRFILQQVMRPKVGNLSLKQRLEKLSHYGNAWITAFQNRLDNVVD